MNRAAGPCRRSPGWVASAVRSVPASTLAPTLAVALAVTLALVAGCASVPTSSSLERVPIGSGLEQENPSVAVPRPPEPGYSQQQIVSGFVDAMASERDGHRVARSYLSSSSRDGWQPTELTVIDSIQTPEVLSSDEAKVTYLAERVGTINPDNSWAPDSGPYEETFQLVREGGQWRIEEPPDTLLLSRTEFNRGFDTYYLYFFSQDARILVPDPVYLRKGPWVETRLVNALLNGPTEWSGPAVRSAIPEGAQLAAPSVDVVDNVATIELDNSVLELEASGQERVAAQLAWTLQQVGIDRVRLAVNGRTIRVGGEDEFVAPDRYGPGLISAVDQPYAAGEAGVVMVTMATGLVPVGWVTGPAAQAPREIAPGLLAGEAFEVAGDSAGSEGSAAGGEVVAGAAEAPSKADRLALITADGGELWIYRDDVAPEGPAYVGSDLSGLSWDRTGKLWFVDRRSDGSRISYIDEEGEPHTVEAPEFETADVRGLRISRDGARVAVLLGSGEQSSVQIARVERGGGEVVMAAGRDLPVPMEEITGLGWSGPTELTMIGLVDSDQTRVVRSAIDGSTQTVVADPVSAGSLAAAPGRPLLLADGDDDMVFVHTPGREVTWRSLDPAPARVPAYPG